jgi:hypothetical protein
LLALSCRMHALRGGGAGLAFSGGGSSHSFIL